MKKELICIACPIGCHLTVDIDKDYHVTGNNCPKGISYGKKELTNPTRPVTSTVIINGGLLPRIPVKTSGEIPKLKIFEVMKEINQAMLTAPVSMGDIVIKNVLGLNVDIITTRSMKKVIQ
jgi:CxxC motif-containing protein